MTAPESKSSALAIPVSALWGVGPERAAQLERLGIHTIEELLLHRPRRYEDRRQFGGIANLELGEPATTRGSVVACGLKRFGKGGKSLFEMIVEDGTGRLHCRWWNLPFMEKYFAVGDDVFVYGKPTSLKPRAMDHPETEVIEGGEESFIHINRIAPVYPLTEGLPQRWLRGLIWRALQKFGGKIEEDPRLQFPATTNSFPYPSRGEAIRMLHFPQAPEEPGRARERLALDEFVELQRQIQQRRRNFESKSRGLPCRGDNHLIRPFLAGLGFKLTEAQTKVLREIRRDLGGAHPMRRLLQGDVGSGKTAVAACAALMAMESGYGTALMAPTEILAEQHYANFKGWFEPLGLAVELRTGAKKTPNVPVLAANSQIGGAGNGAAKLVIGTHALIEAGFAIEDLGLVIIDEQHKFGVAQREQLVRKGRYPHLLVMTATPIPRTLGLTLYGDLDISVIMESPGGRGRVKTFVRTADKLPKAWEFIREKLAEGRQAYVIYPRIEESGAGGLKAVTKEFDRLKALVAPYRAELLHGRMKSAAKEEVMKAFRANQAQILVSTSLIEVGVDVPNATVMLIENAEGFGLAQLHQLRGRIGRGAHASYCILISDAKEPASRERLGTLERTTDGFKIAETDMQLRGPGELLGQEQSGLPKFRFGDLRTDLELIRQAKGLANREAA